MKKRIVAFKDGTYLEDFTSGTFNKYLNISMTVTSNKQKARNMSDYALKEFDAINKTFNKPYKLIDVEVKLTEYDLFKCIVELFTPMNLEVNTLEFVYENPFCRYVNFSAKESLESLEKDVKYFEEKTGYIAVPMDIDSYGFILRIFNRDKKPIGQVYFSLEDYSLKMKWLDVQDVLSIIELKNDAINKKKGL